jgi:uncharacterized protein
VSEEGPDVGGRGPGIGGQKPEDLAGPEAQGTDDEHPDGSRPPTVSEPPPPDQAPVFWGYSDLFLFAGFAVPAMLAGFGLVKGSLYVFKLHPSRAAELLTEQFIGYLFLFLVLQVIFRFQYDRPFWASLGWTRIPKSPLSIVAAGWLTAFAVALVGVLIHTPTTSNPLTDLMEDRASIILIAVFGVSFGPIAEELAFRGFLQPLLVRSLGALPGIVLAALPFGLLHFSEYGNSWRHVVLICSAGLAFGWMRHATGSTKASTLMHSAYNAVFFVALWGSKR